MSVKVAYGMISLDPQIVNALLTLEPTAVTWMSVKVAYGMISLDPQIVNALLTLESTVATWMYVKVAYGIISLGPQIVRGFFKFTCSFQNVWKVLNAKSVAG